MLGIDFLGSVTSRTIKVNKRDLPPTDEELIEMGLGEANGLFPELPISTHIASSGPPTPAEIAAAQAIAVRFGIAPR